MKWKKPVDVSPGMADAPIGESWEISAEPSSPSVVANGKYSGIPLPDVISEHPIEILGRSVSEARTWQDGRGGDVVCY